MTHRVLIAATTMVAADNGDHRAPVPLIPVPSAQHQALHNRRRLRVVTMPIAACHLLPESVEQDYLTYESQLLDVKAHYGSKPHALNTSALWYKSLSYPSSAVVSKDAKTFMADEPMEHGVGYGTYFNVDESKTLVFYTFWAPQKPASGGVYVLEMLDGVVQTLTATKIPGGTRVHVLNNTDGTKTIVLPGVDEGELVIGEPGDAPSYLYDANNLWTDANMLSGAHGSVVFDFQSDGDDDVFLQSWGGEFNDRAMVFKNDAGSLSPLEIPPSRCAGYHVVGAVL